MSACYGCMKYGVIYVALLFMVSNQIEGVEQDKWQPKEDQ